MTRTRIRLLSYVVAMTAAGSACNAESPVSPAASLSTISGHVYFQHPGGGEPMIADVRISVTGGDGSRRSAVSDADGFYSVAVRSGSISITASKEGYEAKVSQFELVDDTVLNFSLVPLEATPAPPSA